jgi:sugar/nucleoside kinase (ribokinase family)
VHCNKDELETLTGETGIAQGLTRLCGLTGSPAIVTLGATGAALFDGERMVTIPSKRIAVVDTIGAGDSHSAGYIVGKMLGFPDERAVLLANGISAEIVCHASGSFEGLDAPAILAEIRAGAGGAL